MTDPKPARSVFRWWTPNTAGDDALLRKLERRDRIMWSVSVRWGFVAVGVVATPLATVTSLPIRVDWTLLASVTALLAGTNLLYTLMARPVAAEAFRLMSPRRFLVVQSTTDYVALGVLSYALGTVETPITALYLAHIFMLTLYCPPRQSLAMTLIAATCASAPALLTAAGALAPVSVLGSNLAARLAASGWLTGVYVAGVFATFLLCWALVASLANGLHARERRLEASYDRLVTLSEQKVRGTLRATHELKAPLAAITSYVYTMRDGYTGELTPQTRMVIERIGDRCDLLMKRISQIIHLANLKTLTAAELSFQVFDLVPLVDAQINDAIDHGRARGVTVVTAERTVSSATIRGSEPELKSMLSNILRNAVDYSHAGGVVTVSVGSDKGGVHWTVSDQGIGIPPEALDRIYEDHFRTDHAVAHCPNGSGLGMAIVAEVVRLHDAEIAVTSELNKGTTVCVTFPHATVRAKERDR